MLPESQPCQLDDVQATVSWCWSTCVCAVREALRAPQGDCERRRPASQEGINGNVSDPVGVQKMGRVGGALVHQIKTTQDGYIHIHIYKYIYINHQGCRPDQYKIK